MTVADLRDDPPQPLTASRYGGGIGCGATLRLEPHRYGGEKVSGCGGGAALSGLADIGEETR